MVIWWIADELSRLSGSAERAIADPEARSVVSAVCVWEIAIKRRLGKLDVPPDLLGTLEDSGVELLPITLRHADRVATLPDHHGDPFDRLLVAQAQIEGMTLVSGDRRLAAYEVDLVW